MTFKRKFMLCKFLIKQFLSTNRKPIGSQVHLIQKSCVVGILNNDFVLKHFYNYRSGRRRLNTLTESRDLTVESNREKKANQQRQKNCQKCNFWRFLPTDINLIFVAKIESRTLLRILDNATARSKTFRILGKQWDQMAKFSQIWSL